MRLSGGAPSYHGAALYGAESARDFQLVNKTYVIRCRVLILDLVMSLAGWARDAMK